MSFLQTIVAAHPTSFMSSTFFVLLAFTLALWLARRLRPRRYYLVRHGESLLNAEHIRQGPDGALSEAGREQAARTGRYLAHVGIQKILASPYERTRETASVISEYVRAPIAYSALLAERRNPSEIIGKHTDDPEVMRVADQIDHAYHDDAYRFSDEENFQDLKRRARICLRMLSWQSERRVCVVTHSFFLKMLIAYLLYRESLHASDYVKLSFFNASDNASITICEFRPLHFFSKTRGWRVVSYNQQPDEPKTTLRREPLSVH